MRSNPPLGGALAALAIALAHCGGGQDGDQAAGGTGGSAASPDGSAGTSGASGSAGASASPHDQFCAGTGPVVEVPSGAAPICTGDLGPKAFRFALCSCDDLILAGKLTTDSFNSQGTSGDGDGASVGSDGRFGAVALTSIKGSLWSAGPIDAGGDLNVSGDLHAGGGVVAAGFSVGGDAYVNGNITGFGNDVSGKLYQPSGHHAIGLDAAGGVVHQPVSVDDPCDCKNPLDVEAAVAAFAQNNDDAAGGVPPGRLSGLSGTNDIKLDCGRYYFTGVSGEGETTLALTGRTAVFVDGDFTWAGTFGVSLAEGAELDLFITGNFLFAGAPNFGDVTAPARVRVFVGGNTVALAALAKFGANVYAPHARAGIAGGFTASGSILAKEFGFAGDLTLHYDEAVLSDQGGSCRQPGAHCSSAHDCDAATPACKSGTCVACTATADCLAPLFCLDGACVVEPSKIH